MKEGIIFFCIHNCNITERVFNIAIQLNIYKKGDSKGYYENDDGKINKSIDSKGFFHIIPHV
jgi:hypothetical protein